MMESTITRRSFLVGLSAVALGAGSVLAGCSGSSSGSGGNAGSSSAASSSPSAPSIEVKASLDDYSWEELSQISKEISAASDRDAVAQSYNLLNKQGELDGSQVKKLDNDYDDEVILMGYDENGLAFIAAVAWGQCTFDNYGFCGNVDGYTKSDLRKFLNGSKIAGMLPSDLKAVIKSVSKQNFSGTSCSDTLWIPSLAEIGYDKKYENCENEGPAYKLFESGENGRKAGLLRRTFEGEPINWWTRSMLEKEKAPTKGKYAGEYMVKLGYVASNGENIYSASGAFSAYGLVPCFYV